MSAKIFKLSGYLIDPNGDTQAYWIDDKISEDLDCIAHHIEVEEAEVGEWEDDNPLNYHNCPIEECEKYFTPTDKVAVVRCKDCKYRHSSEFCECRPTDGYCNDGERKRRMTDAEIIQALEHCVECDCIGCPNRDTEGHCLDGLPYSMVLGVIQRQQEAVEKLDKESADKERAYTEEYVLRKELQSELKAAKVDTIKEFVVRLDKKAMNGATCSGCVEVVEWSDVVEVMEEMVGDTE